MTRREFRAFRAGAVARLAALGARVGRGSYDEQGLPAYTNPNFLMRRVFWRRIRVVAGRLDRLPKVRLAVDFGSGLGLMIPLLAARAGQTVAVEVELDKLAEGTRSLGIDPGAFRAAASLAEAVGPVGPRAGLILALDVLEHVADLDRTVGEIAAALAPDGRLIVSGPTENVFYRLGRRLAGYSGHYHRRAVADIETALKREFRVVAKRVVYPLLPLFVVLDAVPARSLKRGSP